MAPYTPLVQVKTATGTGLGGAITPTFNNATQSGNFIAVYIGAREGTTGDLNFTVDYNGAALSTGFNGFSSTGGFADSGATFYLENITGSGSPVVTITPSGTDNAAYEVIAMEFKNVNTSSSLDRAVGANGPSGTLAQAVELAICGTRARSNGVRVYTPQGWGVAENFVNSTNCYTAAFFTMTNSTNTFACPIVTTGAAFGYSVLTTFRATVPAEFNGYYDLFPKENLRY